MFHKHLTKSSISLMSPEAGPSSAVPGQRHSKKTSVFAIENKQVKSHDQCAMWGFLVRKRDDF